jgi:hypothetical protein
VGGLNGAFSLSTPVRQEATVTLMWSSVDGGTYQIESTADLNNWSTNATNVPSQGINTQTNLNSGASVAFYRVGRPALANYDPVTGTTGGGGQTITLTPNSSTQGQTNISIFALINSANPPVPPHTDALISTFTIGALSVTSAHYTYNSGAGTGTVTGFLSIPANATLGNQTVTIAFSPPLGQSSGPSYIQVNGFTINP